MAASATNTHPLAPAVTGRLALLAAALRAGGMRVGLGELIRAHRALTAVDPTSRRDSFLALRSAFCSRRADLAVFEGAFEAVFGRPEDPSTALIDEVAQVALPRAGVPGAAALEAHPADDLHVHPVPAAASAEELLLEKDFAAYSDAERAQARRLLARLAERGPVRPSRRLRPAPGHGTRPLGAARRDLRRTMRASLRYGGEPVERRWRAPSERPRPVVLVCDVSGSMAPYARMLLQYLQASVAARRRVEAFVFGTRLTRVTRELATRDPDRALARAAEAVTDWSGGTRIGDSLATLNREHGRRIGRGAVVVVLSDGWDRGDPDTLAAEIARLRRCAHALVWLNPLKAQPGYEPLTRGMTAALPHVDHFLAGNSIRSLEQLAGLLEGGMR